MPGLTTWVASLPAADSAACWAAIDELAQTMHGEDPTRTLQQCRADALVDLMLTNVTVATTVTLMIPVQTATVAEPHGSLERDLIVRAAGAHEPTAARPTAPAALCLNPLANTDDFARPTPEPNPFIEPSWAQICAMGYEIPGIGVIGGDVVASILDHFDTAITRVLLDEHTGVVIETSLDTYLPNKAIRRFIQKRDRTCRFPSCRRGATRCEPDHIIAYSRGGPTAAWNLASLCKHHHRVKHHGGWKLSMTRDGGLHLDRPPRPPIRHLPGQPPRARRLNAARTFARAHMGQASRSGALAVRRTRSQAHSQSRAHRSGDTRGQTVSIPSQGRDGKRNWVPALSAPILGGHGLFSGHPRLWEYGDHGLAC